MTSSALPEGTPILCRNCGGHMSMLPDASIACQYCGTRDVLPADELGRALELKNRLAVAEQRAAHVRGFDVALASVFETPKAFLRVMGLYLGVAGLIFVGSVFQFTVAILPHASKLEGQDIIQTIVGQAIGPLFVLGMAFSCGVTLLTGRVHYRRSVRPLLIARPPRQPHAPFACRACGGDLPQTRSANVSCQYCHTTNLIPAELHGSHATSLFREAESARQQLHQASAVTMSIASKMRRTLVLCIVATVMLGCGGLCLIQALMQ
ncbi:hypothetical protein ACFL5O_11000 [Myxococcota bacterium]